MCQEVTFFFSYLSAAHPSIFIFRLCYFIIFESREKASSSSVFPGTTVSAALKQAHRLYVAIDANQGKERCRLALLFLITGCKTHSVGPPDSVGESKEILRA